MDAHADVHIRQQEVTQPTTQFVFRRREPPLESAPFAAKFDAAPTCYALLLSIGIVVPTCVASATITTARDAGGTG
ncbi:MAG: hypothetical protein R3C10_03295 [Pirellulales bacterium]